MKKLFSKVRSLDVDAVVFFVVIVLSAFSWGNAKAAQGSGYDQSQARQVMAVNEGVVLQVRKTTIAGSQTASYTGTAIGTAIGGLGGYRTGGNYAVGAVTAALGGVIGNHVAERISSSEALEFVVRMQDKRIVAITQAADEHGLSIAAGDRIAVIGGPGWGTQARAVKISYSP